MPKIKDPLLDILSKLSTLQATNSDQQLANIFSRVWNNQYLNEQEGKTQYYPKPAAFVEIVMPVSFEVLGEGYRSADIAFRIHIVHEFFNADGTFEQDLLIYELRDLIIKALHLYSPSGCGALTAVSEEQDYDHTNVNHYIIDFVCNFIDATGSTDSNYIVKEPDTGIVLNVLGVEGVQAPPLSY